MQNAPLGAFCNTVKPAVVATSIKHNPPISGHFRAPRKILNANAPLSSVHLSNAASGQRNLPQNTESVSLNNHLLGASLIKFHRLTFLHRSYAWCNFYSPAVVSPRINSSTAATLCQGYWAQLFGSLWCNGSTTATGPNSTKFKCLRQSNTMAWYRKPGHMD